ncbi:unnamed protein product, partial [Heterosigma akashiwo]
GGHAVPAAAAAARAGPGPPLGEGRPHPVLRPGGERAGGGHGAGAGGRLRGLPGADG